VSCLMLARWRSRGSARMGSISYLASLPRVFDGSESGCCEMKRDPVTSAHRIDSKMIVIRMILSYWFLIGLMLLPNNLVHLREHGKRGTRGKNGTRGIFSRCSACSAISACSAVIQDSIRLNLRA